MSTMKKKIDKGKWPFLKQWVSLIDVWLYFLNWLRWWELTQTNIETLVEDRYTRDVHALSLRKLTLINQEVTYIAYLKYSHLHIT